MIMSFTGGANAPERHRLDEEMNIDLVHCPTAIPELTDKSIYRLLIATEDKRDQGVRRRRNSGKRLIKRLVCEAREKNHWCVKLLTRLPNLAGLGFPPEADGLLQSEQRRDLGGAQMIPASAS